MWFFSVSTKIDRIRSEAAASKPPDISALEEDMERFEEDVMDLEKKLKKVQDQFDAAKQVRIVNFNYNLQIYAIPSIFAILSVCFLLIE